jgi:hypothetical protein
MSVTVATLREDVRITLADCFTTESEGFVIWAELMDGVGNRCLICIDSRPRSPTCHRLFQGATHPRDPGARLVDLGHSDEGIIVPLLSQWLDHFEPWGEGANRFRFKEMLHEALLRLGEPPLTAD